MVKACDIVDKIVGTYAADEQLLVLIIDKYDIYSDEGGRNYISDENWGKVVTDAQDSKIFKDNIGVMYDILEDKIDQITKEQIAKYEPAY